MAAQRYLVMVVELDDVKPRHESGWEDRNLWPGLHPWLARGSETMCQALDSYF